jgi:hypothetical protein
MAAMGRKGCSLHVALVTNVALLNGIAAIKVKKSVKRCSKASILLRLSPLIGNGRKWLLRSLVFLRAIRGRGRGGGFVAIAKTLDRSLPHSLGTTKKDAGSETLRTFCSRVRL